MSFPRYERYKDSGPTWFGRVPSHWAVFDGRRVFTQKRYASLPDDPQLSATQKYGVIPQTLFMELEQQKVVLALKGTDAFKHVEIDDFIISLRSFQGGIEKSHYRGCVSTAYTVLRSTKDIDAKYWEYLLKSSPYIDALSSVTDGIREGRSISYAQFGGLPLPFPSVYEQTAIAAFLDYETAKIDALIEEQRRLIELLKEKRQAVISHAVTKGLNPNAPMKDSGLEWIGTIPHHWEVGSIKRWFDTVSGGTPNTGQYDEFYTSEGGYPWIRTTDLSNSPLSEFEISITEEGIKNSACSVLPIGSVLVAMYGGPGTIGKNAILKIDATINQALCGLLPNKYFSPSFTFFYIQFYRPHWMVTAVSSRIDPNISQDQIRNAPILRPPLPEQLEIENYLLEKLTAFDSLLSEAAQTCDLLGERRAALISAAVTGKIDVRKYTPKEAA